MRGEISCVGWLLCYWGKGRVELTWGLEFRVGLQDLGVM